MRTILFLLIILLPVLGSAQHQDKVDFIRADVTVELVPSDKRINGFVTYDFLVLKAVDSIFLDAKNMTFEKVLLDASAIEFNNDQKTITIRSPFKKGDRHTLVLSYNCTPKQTVYFLGWEDSVVGNEQIWTQGQGKYTSHWLPSFDDMEEKVEFDLSIIEKTGSATVIANGRLGASKKQHNGSTTWSFDMQKPISSYLLAFAIGNYAKQALKSKSGIPIENYYYPKDSLRVEPTYRHTKEIFDFLEEEIGFAYPWQNYKQVPVRDFLYAGMENTTATLFADGYVIDSTAFIDKNYVNVNAHELAHQWFGNLVTEKDGHHHWLHEGFATYYAQLAEREIFGDDHYYWKLFNTLEQLQDLSEQGKGQSLTDPKANSLTFYEKGAWALVILSDLVGPKTFQKGIKAYLKKYQFKNATVDGFLAEMESVSKQNLSAFRQEWLQNTVLPYEAAKNLLRSDSHSLAQLFTLKDQLANATIKTYDLEPIWNTTSSTPLRGYIIDRYHDRLGENLWAKALSSDTILIRQKVALHLDSIPQALKPKFEALLTDASYVTIENALFKLWASYPEDRTKYLEQTKGVVGLPNKNVRLLWLTLAILTNDYKGRNTPLYFKELNAYTSKEYGWEIRMAAFQYLHQALGLTDDSLRNLIDAAVHHSWQFKKFARNLIDELLKDGDYKARFQALENELNDEESRYLKTKIH